MNFSMRNFVQFARAANFCVDEIGVPNLVVPNVPYCAVQRKEVHCKHTDDPVKTICLEADAVCKMLEQ